MDTWNNVSVIRLSYIALISKEHQNLSDLILPRFLSHSYKGRHTVNIHEVIQNARHSYGTFNTVLHGSCKQEKRAWRITILSATISFID